MNINGIDIPERILMAQQENKLVIFAGAGVSVAPPSRLPSFDKLAEEVEAVTFCYRKKEEPIDTYLGRVHHEGKNIYKIIGKILSDSESYNEYHTNLLKLFPSDQIRIVTTNQDIHFTTAAKEMFKNEIKLYYAPALPLATNFTGIVYLHGSIMDNLENMVFTDGDFGEAYLVEGWASRFLKDLFSNFIVLFIGYSYNDPVMRYFSRGMQYNENRFIFTCREDNANDHWERLHITPVYYNKDNNHIQILECITKWARMYSYKYTDQKERLNAILSDHTMITAEDKDYLFYIISKDYGVNFFCNLTRDYYWFKFLLNENKLEFIFNEKQLEDNEMRLVCWVVDNFLSSNIEDFLIILNNKGSYLNSYFTNLALGYFYNLKKEEKKENKILLTEFHHVLFSIILNQPYKITGKLYLELLLLELEMPKDINIILLLFKYMLKPEIKLEKTFRLLNNNEFKDSICLMSVLFGEIYNLEKVWEEILKPSIHLVANNIILTVSEYIKSLYSYFNGNNEGRYDLLSHKLSSIERHEQDLYKEDFLFLIDVARDTIDYIVLNDLKMCDAIITIWSNSSALLLERLSIYTIQKAKHINADEKVDWLIGKGWLYKIGAKKEVFDLIKFSYADLTSNMKKKLIMEIINSNKVKDKDYQVYNFLIYLKNDFPADENIKTELENVVKRNPNFKPSEHPEFDTWHESGFYGDIRSPKSKKELLLEDSVNVVDDLLKYHGSYASDERWYHYLSELAEAVGDSSNNYNWTEKLISELERRNILCSDIFQSIIRGLEKEPIHPDMLKKLLNLIKMNYCSCSTDFRELISWFILGQIRNNRKNVKTIGVNTATDVIQFIYSNHKNNPISINVENISYNHTNFLAHNLLMGIFGIFDIIMEDDKKLDSSPANQLFDFIEEIAFDKSEFSMSAKSIIAVDYAFINYYRPELADRMIELFDMNISKKCARIMWAEFLKRGKYNDGVIKKLFNNFKKLYNTISMEDDEYIKAFCNKAVGIAIYCEIDETKEKKWIIEMISAVNDNIRVTFADAFHRQLSRLDTNKADQLWDDWIRDYFCKRNSNIPIKLSQYEINEMMRWVVHFDQYFNEAVEYITQNDILFNMHIILDLENEDKDLINKHPVSARAKCRGTAQVA